MYTHTHTHPHTHKHTYTNTLTHTQRSVEQLFLAIYGHSNQPKLFYCFPLYLLFKHFGPGFLKPAKHPSGQTPEVTLEKCFSFPCKSYKFQASGWDVSSSFHSSPFLRHCPHSTFSNISPGLLRWLSISLLTLYPVLLKFKLRRL